MLVTDKNPLPVTLTEFKALRLEQTALLNWKTVAETNSASFDIQHSLNGKVWTVLGNIAAKGESTALQSYSFHDNEPVSGENLYRLKMIDHDGTFAYSHIATLTFTTQEDITVFPNPVADMLQIKVQQNWDNVKKIKIFNMNSEIVYSATNQKLTRAIDVKSIPPGLYVVQITDNKGHTNVTKVAIFR